MDKGRDRFIGSAPVLCAYLEVEEKEEREDSDASQHLHAVTGRTRQLDIADYLPLSSEILEGQQTGVVT